jgi:hypothetical protein
MENTETPYTWRQASPLLLGIFLTSIGLLGLDAVFTALVGLGITAVGYVLIYIALGGTIKKLNTSTQS